jgi:hypothetical protein
MATMTVGVLLATANMILNPGFENLTDDGKAADWKAPSKTYSYVKGEGRDGSTALKFSVKKKDPYTFPTQDVKVEPGKRYRFSAWVRTKDVDGKGAGATISVGSVAADGKWLGSGSAHGVRGTVDEWKKISFTVDVPTNAVKCEIAPYLSRGRTGTAWFDDISCIPEERPVLGALVSSIYRDTAIDGEAVFSSALFASAEEFASKGYKAVFEIPKVGNGLLTRLMKRDSSASAKISVVPAEIAGGVARTKVDVSTLPMGVSEITLKLTDVYGKVVESQKLTFNRVEKMPGWKVRIDKANRLLVDGKPFYPVSIYVSWYSDQMLEDIINSPFNTVMCYRHMTREQLDRFHAAGKKVIYSIKDVLLGRPACPKEIVDDKTEYNWVDNHVKKFKDHPAILAWYINDELGPEWLDKLRVRYDHVRAIDPDHPAFMVLYQIGKINQYAGTYDVMGTDPYPVAGKEPKPISMVADWTLSTRRDTFGKAVWQAPQIFDWSAYQVFKGVKHRAPTEAEIRNMVWQCAVAGANGVCTYNYNGLRKKQKVVPFETRWAEVCRVYGEFARHTDVFLSTEKAPAVAGAPDGVYVCTWRHKGQDWLLVINTLETFVKKCTLEIEGYGAKEMFLAPLDVQMSVLRD